MLGRYCRLLALCGAAVLLMGPAPWKSASVALAENDYGVNLISNGDAEMGMTTGDGGIDIPYWSLTGPFEVVQYGASGGFPQPTDPGPADRGTYLFAGGQSNGLSSAMQPYDVPSDDYADIDAGNVSYTLSGYLGGFDGQDDNATLTETFEDAKGQLLGTATIGPVLSSDRNSATGLLFMSKTGTLRAGTRSIITTLTMTRTAGDYNDGYADDLSLVLSASGGPSDTTPPEITPTVTGTSLRTGWYASDVDVTWSVTDPESEIASETGCDETTVTTDTLGTTFSCTATSAGGTNSNSVTLARDATPPDTVFTGRTTYTVDQDVAITCASQDATSGIQVDRCGDITGPAYTFAPSTTFTAGATDIAGNDGSSSVTVRVMVTQVGLCLVSQRFGLSRAVNVKLCQQVRDVAHCPRVACKRSHAAAYKAAVDALVANRSLQAYQASRLKFWVGLL